MVGVMRNYLKTDNIDSNYTMMTSADGVNQSNICENSSLYSAVHFNTMQSINSLICYQIMKHTSIGNHPFIISKCHSGVTLKSLRYETVTSMEKCID